MSSQTARRDEEEESGPEEHDNLKKAFEDEQGHPIWFFLHKSITSDWQRQNLADDIQLNGGIVRPNDSDVDTVLVGQACNRENLQLAYNSHSNPSKRRIWVEPMAFVSRCLREGVVRHRQPEPKGMGGTVGSDRTPFTDEDDENLARYLAIRIPDIQNGGRRGKGVYKDLYRAYSEDPEEYAWVSRHPQQSWRNRYNKNIIRFNAMIDIHVELEKPEPKQAYCLQRKHQGWQWADESGEKNEEQFGTPSKRRRVDLSPDPPGNRAEVRRSLIRKGKERAVPQEDVNDIHREPSPFHEDLPASEPGPSKRGPITTYAHRSSRRSNVSPPLHDPEPYTSQATLVESNHQTQEHTPLKRAIPDLPSQQREDSNVIRRETGAEVQQNRSPLSLKEPNLLAALVSSAQISGAGASTKVVSTSPRHRPMARKTAQRSRTPSEPAVIAPLDPPYRNTRSRSRSVEPSDLPLRPKPRRKKGTVSEHRGTTLPSLEESANENYQPPVETLETHPLPDPIGETWEEERDVEDILVNISGQSQVTEDESQSRTKDNPAQNAKDDRANELRSLDSDDAHTDDRLRQPQIQATIRVRPEESDVSPDEMLRRFREASTNTFRSSRGPIVRSMSFSQARADSMRPRHSAPVYSHDVFSGVSLTEQPRTPANPQSQLQRGSTSSIESFPIAGTKASAAKKNLETEEKRTPYRPPVGTRAALLTKEHHIPRSRKAALRQ